MRILIFGGGSAFLDLLSILPANVEIAGVCDNDLHKVGKIISGHQVSAPAFVSTLKFDFAVVTGRAGEAIRRQLVDMGVEPDRILLFNSNFDSDLRMKVNKDLEALNLHLGLGLHPWALCTMQLWPNVATQVCMDDYCRHMSIHLAAERINRQNIPGAIAELGVYRGELAAILNQLFADRTLYLFDTFEGFSVQDLADGQEAKHSEANVGDFQDTYLDVVLSRMRFPHQVIVRKGYFPETAEGLTDKFAMVSLDVDLYKPTLAGLKYFYPQLSKGGCIFVHDYNNRRYGGVKSAVEEFLGVTDAPLVQLPDLGGTAMILK
jgi:hypothetical protein